MMMMITYFLGRKHREPHKGPARIKRYSYKEKDKQRDGTIIKYIIKENHRKNGGSMENVIVLKNFHILIKN